METPRSIRGDVAYLKELASAGLAGVASGWQSNGAVITPSLKTVWGPMTAGAAAGLIAARYLSGRKKPSTAAIAGVAGTVAGLVAAVAWTSRGFMRAAARNAARRIAASRDAHWLQSNPIDYA